MHQEVLFGLIGYPLEHSFSPAYFNKKFAEEGLTHFHYKAFPIKDIEALQPLLIEHHNLKGFNVTIPYKQSILSLLKDLTPVAKKVQAVNCVAVLGEKLVGHNTDVVGFELSIKPALQPWHKQALILGNGGAAQAVKVALENLGVGYLSVVRKRQEKEQICYEEVDANIMETYQLIINTTPLGMHPFTLEYPPLPYTFLQSQHLLYDLIYNPAETTFLQKAKQQGAATINGLAMLRLQAEASWQFWQSTLHL